MDAEKIICCDRGNSGLETAALMNGSMGNWNNPFIYLVWMMFANRMWGNGWENGGNPQIQSLQNQMQDNQNANLIIDGIKGNAAAISTLSQNLNCDFNTLQQCCCDVRNAITQVGGQIGFSAERVINAVNMGDCNVIQAIKDCCCGTQKAILEQGYQNQLQNCQQTQAITSELTRGFSGLNFALSQGFSQVGFLNEQQTCKLIENQNRNTQELKDLLNVHWTQDLRDQLAEAKLKISQSEQNAYLLANLKTTSTPTA